MVRFGMYYNKKEIGIGLIGFGTVGSSVARIINRMAPEFKLNTGRRVHVEAALVNNMHKKREYKPESIFFTDSADAFFNRRGVDLIVENMGGTDIAFSYITRALQSGRAVVTANKALLASHGKRVAALAQQNQMPFAFEAAVAGGLPIINALRVGLAANAIQEIEGIINGSTNYILSQMHDKGIALETAMQQATELGYLEADPTLDVSGQDAAQKLIIMAAIAFGRFFDEREVSTTGILSLPLAHIKRAKEQRNVIKLVAKATKKGDDIKLQVAPQELRASHWLAQISGELNGIIVRADNVPTSFYAGPGAGGLPTGSAIVSDIFRLICDSTYTPFGFQA